MRILNLKVRVSPTIINCLFMIDQKINIFGKDSLLMYSFQYYFLAAFIYIGILWPDRIRPWVLICFIYGVLPLLDELFTQDWRNPTEQ